MVEWFSPVYNELLKIRRQIDWFRQKRRILTRQTALKLTSEMRKNVDQAERLIGG